MRPSDSDLDDSRLDASEDEVLAPRVDPSMPGSTPVPAKRRQAPSATGGLLMGSALAVLAVGFAGLLAAALLAYVLLT